VFNKNYNKSDMMESLALSLKKNFDDTIVCYADIIFEKKIIIDLVKTVQKNNNIIIPGLKNWKKIWNIRSKNNYDFESFKNKGKKLIEIGKKKISKKDVKAQFMGIFFIPKMKINNFLKFYKSRTNKIQTTSFINYLIKKGNYIQTYTKKYNWFEFDDYEDYKNFKKNDFSKLFSRY
jgi:choline kinase